MIAGGGGDKKEKVSQISEKPLKGVDRYKEMANAAQVSHDTIAKVKTIEAKATPEVKAMLASIEVMENIKSDPWVELPMGNIMQNLEMGTQVPLSDFGFSDI